MTLLRQISDTLARRQRRFSSDEAGSTLVEFAIVMPLFLLILFALIDFGRMGFEYVMANKAVQMAARVAVTRPPACAGVPEINTRGAVPAGTTPPNFGTNCRAGNTVCAAPATVSCFGNTNNATAAEIWNTVRVLMPVGAQVSNLHFSYIYTSELGFLGGPYVPMVNVEIRNLNFQFVMPLDGLAALAGSADANLPGTLPFPALSVTLPAEDLALGEAG
jgi:Flp pilus assembly protein TadG